MLTKEEEKRWQEFLNKGKKQVFPQGQEWIPDYVEPSPTVPYDEEELLRQYDLRDQAWERARNMSVPEKVLPVDIQHSKMDVPGPVLQGDASQDDTEHAFNLGGWLKDMGSSVLGSVNSGMSDLGDWMQKNPELVASIASGLGRYAWDPDVGRGPMGGWSNRRALWNAMDTGVNTRLGLENQRLADIARKRGQLQYKDGGFYNIRPTNIGGKPSWSVDQLYQTPSKGKTIATGKVEYKPIGNGMQQGYMFNRYGQNRYTKWGEPKPLYEPKEPKAKKPPESRTRTLPGGKEQLEIFDTTTEKWVPSGDPYDPKLLSAEALAQKQKTRPKTEINLADKGWSEFNKQQAKNVFEMKTDAEGALAGLSSLRESKKLIDSGVITGTGAEWVTAFGNALKTLGWGDMDGVANTQAFMASMGNQVAQIIKQFGAGTGLSDADRDYAEKIVGGKITMSEEAIRRLMDINEKAFKFKIDRYNEVAKSIMGSPNAKQLLFPLTQLEIPTTTEEPWRVWLHNNPGRAEEYKNKTITVQEGSHRGKYTARQLPDGSWQWFKE